MAVQAYFPKELDFLSIPRPDCLPRNAHSFYNPWTKELWSHAPPQKALEQGFILRLGDTIELDPRGAMSKYGVTKTQHKNRKFLYTNSTHPFW